MNRYALNSALAGLALAALPAPALALELEPKCPVKRGWCFIEFANMPGCYFKHFRHRGKGWGRDNWFGDCTGGLANGEGILFSSEGNI